MVMLVGVMFVWTVAYIAQRNMEGDDGRKLESVLVEELINKSDYITSSGGVITANARVDLQENIFNILEEFLVSMCNKRHFHSETNKRKFLGQSPQALQRRPWLPRGDPRPQLAASPGPEDRKKNGLFNFNVAEIKFILLKHQTSFRYR